LSNVFTAVAMATSFGQIACTCTLSSGVEQQNRTLRAPYTLSEWQVAFWFTHCLSWTVFTWSLAKV